MAAQYLCQLEMLLTLPLSDDFGELLKVGVYLGKQTLEASNQSWPPTERGSAQECFLEYRFGRPEQALVQKAQEGFGPEGWGRVGDRRSKCYQAAILLRSRQHTSQAVGIVNEVFQQFTQSGRFYSTADSISALALFEALRDFGPEWSQPVTEISQGEVVSVRADKGDVLIEVTRLFCQDWSELKSTTQVEATLLPSNVKAGQLVKLEVSVPHGYREGDLVWLSLPRSLAQLEGGGQLRQFSVDLEGNSKVEIDLVALASTKEQGETVLVCLRNMFLEERVALADPLRVQVRCPSVSGDRGPRIPTVFQQADLTRHGLRGIPRTMGQLQTLSGLIHQRELARFLEQLIRQAPLNATRLVLDWVDEGVARSRYKTPSGMRNATQYPASLQVALIGRLQMLSQNALGASEPQEGALALGSQALEVSIVPTSLGMMATVILIPETTDRLSWMHTLSDLQQAISEGRPPDLEALHKTGYEVGQHATVDELLDVLSHHRVSKQRALGLLARLARSDYEIG